MHPRVDPNVLPTERPHLGRKQTLRGQLLWAKTNNASGIGCTLSLCFVRPRIFMLTFVEQSCPKSAPETPSKLLRQC